MSGKTKAKIDARQYEVLAAVYAKEGTQVLEDMAGAYRTKTTKAGDCLYVDCYPLISRELRMAQSELLREMKRTKDRKVQLKYAKYNNARRVRLFDQLVEANIAYGDFHVCCTYERDSYDMGKYGQGEYRGREEAKRDCANYIRRIRRLLKRHGHDVLQFRWIAVTVTKEKDISAYESRPTHHHHILMHGVPEELRGEIERMWPYGFCNADRAQPGDKGLSALSAYVARQEGRANGDHAFREKSFSTSRNIIRPTVTTSDTKISRRRVAQIAADVRANAAEIFAKIYPDYRLVEDPKIMISDFVAGAYIWAKLKRRTTGGDNRRKRKGGCG